MSESDRKFDEEAEIRAANALARAKFINEHGREPTALDMAPGSAAPPAWVIAAQNGQPPPVQAPAPDIVVPEDDEEPSGLAVDFQPYMAVPNQSRRQTPSGPGSALTAEDIALATLDGAGEIADPDARAAAIAYAQVWATLSYARSIREHTDAVSNPPMYRIDGLSGRVERIDPNAR